jgi:hypothetical protein
MFRSYAGMAMLMVALLPAVAQADWLFTPHFGTTFGADTHGREHPLFGGAIAVLDEDAFGWEAEVSYAPNFFEGSGTDFDFSAGNSSVLSVMGNAVIGVPIGGRHRDAFRPYVTGGVGMLQIRVISDGGFFETTTREFGFNLGAGAMGFLTERVGFRGDLRYLRSFQNQVPSWTRGIDFDIAPDSFDYFRATFGLTFRFGE